MLGLQITTEVKRQLPKVQIYRKFELKQSQQNAFDADISRMEIVNMIAPQTLPAISMGEDVKAIFVVDVELKRKEYDTKNIVLVSKLIPQRIVFVLRFEDQARLAVYHTKLFTTQWQSVKAFNLTLSGLNLDAVWQNIVTFVGGLEVSAGNSLNEQIRVDEERSRLMRQIESLERQMRSTSQSRRQRELYSEIKKLRAKI